MGDRSSAPFRRGCDLLYEYSHLRISIFPIFRARRGTSRVLGRGRGPTGLPIFRHSSDSPTFRPGGGTAFLDAAAVRLGSRSFGESLFAGCFGRADAHPAFFHAAALRAGFRFFGKSLIPRCFGRAEERPAFLAAASLRLSSRNFGESRLPRFPGREERRSAVLKAAVQRRTFRLFCTPLLSRFADACGGYRFRGRGRPPAG